MFDIDYIIPCYGKSEVIRPGLRSLANQWHSEFIHVYLINDCSPNTDCNYQDLVDEFSNYLDICCIKTDKNVGQGLARQAGVDASTHDYLMFQDEDDLLANPLAISLFVGHVEGNIYKTIDDKQEVYELDENGAFIRDESKLDVALVSGPLFEFDDHYSNIIESSNHVWVNSKLYNRKFLEKHDIRFNEAQSRHAEDYYFTSCFFYCLEFDQSYTSILMDNQQLTYIWYPNTESQSRKDDHYGYMLSGYTMDGSINILDYMKDTKRNGLTWDEEKENQYRHDVLNMTVYSYFTFLSFIRHVASTDYIPELENDWYLLRDSCDKLRRKCLEYYPTYTYTEKIDEYYCVHTYTDVDFTEPWIDLDTYICEGCEEFSWSFEKLLECKETYIFNERGMLT